MFCRGGYHPPAAPHTDSKTPYHRRDGNLPSSKGTMDNYSEEKMKRIITFILFALMVLGCCACQPTPKEPVVTSKNDGTLERIISGKYPEYNDTSYSAPDTWTETLDGMDDYKLKINIDAKISTPKSLSYPVFRVEKAELSQDEADGIIEYFTGGEKLYDYGAREYSDEYYRGLLKTCEDMLDNPDSVLNTEYIKDKGEPDGLYDACKKACENGRETALKVLMLPKDGTETVPTFDKAISHRISAEVFLDGCRVYTYELDKEVFLSEKEGGRQVRCTINNRKFPVNGRAYNPDREYLVSQSDAIHIADSVMHDMGFDKWNLVDISTQNLYIEGYKNFTYQFSELNEWKAPAAYVLTYTKDIFEDIPLLYFSNSNSELNGELREMSSYAPALDFTPYVQLTVTDEGIQRIVRCADFKIAGTINANVPLLPFDKIQEIFRNKMPMSTSYSYSFYRELNPDGDYSHTEIDISDIRLGYVQIREKNANTTMLMPVWCFFGRQKDYTDGSIERDRDFYTETPQGFVFLCINAVDGSIIDLTRGY